MTELSFLSYDFLFGMLMIFIGLPHGASDILVLYKKLGITKTILISLIYAIFFLVGMLLWLKSSTIYFVILWVISLIHFLDVENQLGNMLGRSYEDIMFFSLFSLPLLKSDEFITYMRELNGENFSTVFLNLANVIYTIQIILSFYFLNRSFKNNSHKRHLLLWIVTGLIVYNTSILNSFLIIFIFIHSLRHLKLSYIKKIFTLKSYILILIPISIASIIVIYYFKDEINNISNNRLFFTIGLGSLAFPHFIVEHLFKSHKLQKRTAL